MTWINTIFHLYQNTIFRYTRISATTIIFTVCCAINYQWFNFSSNWFPFEKHLSIGAINTMQCGLRYMEALFPLLTCILFIVLCIHLSAFIHQLVTMISPSVKIEKILAVSGDVSKYLVMNFWLYYFIMRTIIFSDFSLSQPFSISFQWFSPNYYLVSFFSLFTILDIIFAPIHYRHAKRHQLEEYLKKSENTPKKNDKN